MPRPLSSALADIASALRELLHPAARLAWNHDPAAVVIQAATSWPESAPATALNALPDALIRGDGRIVWLERLSGGGRRVNAGRLDERSLAALLEQFAHEGFFRLERWYPAAKDGGSRALSVHLLHTTHEVRAADGAGPRGFAALYERVATGAGAVGLPYRPAEGLLVASPARRSAEGRLPAWDAAATGLRLENATQGAWVEGPALELAWKLVNARPENPRVTQGSGAYLLTLQVPDLVDWEPRLP